MPLVQSGRSEEYEAEIQRLGRELAAVSKEREDLKKEFDELREAYNKVVNSQKESASIVYEKEVELLDDNDALAASFNQAKQELKQTRAKLGAEQDEKEKYLNEIKDLKKQVSFLEAERKSLRTELKECKTTISTLYSEKDDLEEENVNLQKMVSSLKSNMVDFEASKHEVLMLNDQLVELKSHLEETTSLKKISERQMQEALEALQCEREQKYALRKELDKSNISLAQKNSSHLANLALKTGPTSILKGVDIDNEETSFDEQGFDLGNDNDLQSIEGSLYDEINLSSSISNNILNIKNKLYKKQEQIKTLRNVLITNKNCAEVALANLKSKYEMEQAVVKETMTKLRHDVKALKEDAATFAASRLEYNARIEDYKTEIEKLRTKINAFEQEKNTLSSILRMSIEQKVQLTQQVEALEMEREGFQVNHNNTADRNNAGRPYRSHHRSNRPSQIDHRRQ